MQKLTPDYEEGRKKLRYVAFRSEKKILIFCHMASILTFDVSEECIGLKRTLFFTKQMSPMIEIFMTNSSIFISSIFGRN